MKFQFFTDQFEEFIGTNFWTMLFAWINLLILYLFLRKLLFNPVKNMIDRRQKEVDDIYSDARQSREAADAAKAEYEKKLAAAQAESEDILKNAQRRAQLREEEILREADETARKTLARAEEQVALEKKRVLNEVKDVVSGMAIEIASAVIARDVSEKEHAAMIDDFISKLD